MAARAKSNSPIIRAPDDPVPAPNVIPPQYPASDQRRRWSLEGQVQGVGLRPHVYRIAVQLGLSGFVRNDLSGVVIEAQGCAEALAAFERRLRDRPPPLCRIDHMPAVTVEPKPDDHAFVISSSAASSSDAAAPVSAGDITIDAATCDDCLRELFDPQNRRHRYALINCTNCGPRYTIVRNAPYDRPNTTMSHFLMCDDCAAEYADPLDPKNRRFHAQPIACPSCGPAVQLVDPHGCQLTGEPIAAASAMLADRAIIAVKGIGGFHLCCRADDPAVVSRLRRLKHRDAKPFAVMTRDLPTAMRLAHLSDAAIDAMRSPACPIILAPRTALPGLPAVALDVAPGMHRLGLMLPYTPLHHLLFACPQTPDILVMTSANHSDEPLVRDNDQALAQLADLCDAILWHNRPIHRSVDDSVFIDFATPAIADACADDPADASHPRPAPALLPVRRARGYVPTPIDLPAVFRSTSSPASSAPSSPPPTAAASHPPGLCLGGELKNTIAVVRDNQAIVSHHLGDLKHPAAFINFKQAVTDLCDLARITPRWLAHDLHPGYLSTLHAQHLARELRLPLFPVQHHHAHAASVLAEHDHPGPALAIVCDGTGFGTDHSIWGGELLIAGYNDFVRLAHLRPLQLPGGDAAAIDPRRSAMALLHQTLGDDFESSDLASSLYLDYEQRHAVAAMLRHHVRTIPSSAAGRYFDALAAILGFATVNHFEAQAAMALESAAYSARHLPLPQQSPLFKLHTHPAAPAQIDLTPLISRILQLHRLGHERTALAALFHDQFSLAFASAAIDASHRTGLRVVALSGGCFCNQLLSLRISHLLHQHHLTVLHHSLVPPGDAGLSLGQAAVALARLADDLPHKGPN